eukprot:CAMPEP_0204563892 /NCGR_PEP_ID=MMETSP0661-20131031/34576_1 /ASSEMBLY_ACC=CAM_ASM_000606 /TAXON_ID=109239 /ORGANISM="Alexandrium margalefi, Strain AMGDE01CS-322" /LENGTH=83 /DNA_ID=CAMNT_0051571489 /DNA_START=56 /DNA_END=304 /DNA_ORIENTATION=+
MPSRVLVALCALASRSALAAPSFSDEAAEAGRVSEAVRRRADVAPGGLPDFDAELLGRADEIGRQLRRAGEGARPARRAALAA